jgi:hypothetical protein
MNTDEAFEVLEQALKNELEKTRVSSTVLVSNGNMKKGKEVIEKYEYSTFLQL